MTELFAPSDQHAENSQGSFDLYVEQELSGHALAMLMTEASIDQILALDLSLKVIAWNRACEQATGIAREVAVGKTFTELLPGVVNFPHVMSALVKALKGLKSFVPSDKGAYNGGYSEHHFIPLKSSAGVMGVMVIIHNVAHRIKAEQELQRLNQELAQQAKELKEKTEELTQFNWIASHDLKEPLRKIYTFIEMVATNEGLKLSDAARGNLRRAQSAAQRMGLLTDDIATFTQVAAPSEELTTADLNNVLATSISRHERAIENTAAILSVPDLPVITGYPEMLKLLFSHLLGNALKFHEEGAVPEISISHELISGAGLTLAEARPTMTYHRISFRDNGIGVAPEYCDKIFVMFQRLHDTRIYKGTGMGLAICKKVAAAHKGFITVESEEGAGSIFHCYLAAGLR